jgi:two-component system sensor histidine kinase/response regulator
MDNWNNDDEISPGSEISEALADGGNGKVLDIEKAIDQIGGDEELLKEVLQIFIHDVPRKLYELHEASDRQDRERIRRAAH